MLRVIFFTQEETVLTICKKRKKEKKKKVLDLELTPSVKVFIEFNFENK
jgi:hypothetical protein